MKTINLLERRQYKKPKSVKNNVNNKKVINMGNTHLIENFNANYEYQMLSITAQAKKSKIRWEKKRKKKTKCMEHVV